MLEYNIFGADNTQFYIRRKVQEGRRGKAD